MVLESLSFPLARTSGCNETDYKIYPKCDWSSPPEVFYKKGVLRNFKKFTGKQLCQSLFFNKVAGLVAASKVIKLFEKNFHHFPKFLLKCMFTKSASLLLMLSKTPLFKHNKVANLFMGTLLTTITM